MTLNKLAALNPDEIHLWEVNLEEPWQIPADWEQILSREEVERSQRYRFKKDCLHFIIRRVILRRLLYAYTGVAPVSIRYEANSHGKPFLSSFPLRFNLSKSDKRIVYAFTLEHEIGVDVECVRLLRDLEHMAARWFSSQEHAEILTLPAERRTDAFFHVWTQKEAFIKAQGEGLKWRLADFSVSVNPNKPARLLSIKGDPVDALCWKMTGTAYEDGWRLAVCLYSDTELQQRWYKFDLRDEIPGNFSVF